MYIVIMKTKQCNFLTSYSHIYWNCICRIPQKSGGLLRLFQGTNDYVDVEPILNRAIFFWVRQEESTWGPACIQDQVRCRVSMNVEVNILLGLTEICQFVAHKVMD